MVDSRQIPSSLWASGCHRMSWPTSPAMATTAPRVTTAPVTRRRSAAVSPRTARNTARKPTIDAPRGRKATGLRSCAERISHHTLSPPSVRVTATA
jgi:hypothetical protein